jgi:hypothetical protein
MSLWVLIALFGLIKLPLAVLMLWLPFRNDASMHATDPGASAEEDGGSHTPPIDPPGPRPPWPAPARPHGPRLQTSARRRRRGPDCTPPPRVQRRVRAALECPHAGAISRCRR